MNIDILLADKLAHQLLPQLCFSHTNEFFANLHSRDPQEFGQHLWDELARSQGIRGAAGELEAKMVNPEHGLAIFLLRFPVPAQEPGPHGAAAVFRYRLPLRRFAVLERYCFTLEKENGQAVCVQWGDALTKYERVSIETLQDASEQAFLAAIYASVDGRVSSERGWDFNYDRWQARLPAPVQAQIRAILHPADAALESLSREIAQKYPRLEPSIRTIEQRGRDQFYRLGVMSFAVGYQVKGDYEACPAKAASVDELPSELRLIHEQGIATVGALLGDLVELLKRHGYVFDESWNGLCQAVFVGVRDVLQQSVVLGARTEEL